MTAPRRESAGQPLWTALDAAIRAPSPHNTQPWRFEVGSEHIDVLLDRDRLLPVADPDAREAHLACGAAIFNLRTALAAAELATQVRLLPDPTNAGHLATVLITGAHRAARDELALAAAIHTRQSNRRPFAERPIPTWLRHALRRAAEREGSHLLVVERSQDVSAVADELRRAERLQNEDPAYRAELRAWTVGRDEERDDGVAPIADSLRPVAESWLPLRKFYTEESRPPRPYEADPLVAVLASYTDTPLGQLRTGQAMQHVLLTAAATGLSASFLSQLVEVPSSRTRVRELLGGRLHPQVVLRLGYGYAGPTTRRRPVHAVTTAQTREAGA